MPVTQLKPLYKPTLEEHIERFKNLDMRLKQLKKEHAALQKTITDIMGNSTEAFNQFGQVIATYIFINGKKFDKKAFDIAHPGVYDNFETLCEQFTETKQSRRFELKC